MIKKSALRILAASLIISLFAVITFEAFHAGHEEHCHDEDCPLCLVLQVIHSTHQLTGNTQTSAFEFTAFFYINILILSALFFAPATLVKQKVKLVI